MIDVQKLYKMQIDRKHLREAVVEMHEVLSAGTELFNDFYLAFQNLGMLSVIEKERRAELKVFTINEQKRQRREYERLAAEAVAVAYGKE